MKIIIDTNLKHCSIALHILHSKRESSFRILLVFCYIFIISKCHDRNLTVVVFLPT